ncbi:MAG TPA: hypothetical protein VJ866_19665 [Pyrinomonadaceae bacterium]|nr:hypothetical protein [Pyrinomonadaceae bacterium]
MPRRVRFLLPTLFILCAAGAARGQWPEVCENKPIKDPAYYADIKPMPPGKFGFAYNFDKQQFDDPSAPVALSGLGMQSAPRPHANKPSCAEVVNRTTRVVKSVQLRWRVSALAEGQNVFEKAEVLAKGLLPAFEVEVPPGARRRFEMRGVQFADFFQPLAAAGEVNGKFNIVVGVARVEYTDGTAEDLP